MGPFWLQHDYVPCSRLTDSNPAVKSIWEEAGRDDKQAVMKTIGEELTWFDKWAGFEWTKRQEWNATLLQKEAEEEQAETGGRVAVGSKDKEETEMCARARSTCS